MLGACRQCGRAVSDKAVRCPNCGRETPFVVSPHPEDEHRSEALGPRAARQENPDFVATAERTSNEEVALQGWPNSIAYVSLFLVAVIFIFALVAMQNEAGDVAHTEQAETQAATRYATSETPSATSSVSAEEQVNQGLAHYYGRGVAQNYSEAARLFLLAANR